MSNLANLPRDIPRGRPVSALRVKFLENRIPAYVVGGRIGINPTRLSEYATGRKEIPAHHLRLLCDYFQCPPEEIIGFVIVPEVEPDAT